jgi:hypothetical protein
MRWTCVDPLKHWMLELESNDSGIAVPFFTQQSLRELGIDEGIDHGPVTAREERVRAVREKQTC